MGNSKINIKKEQNGASTSKIENKKEKKEEQEYDKEIIDFINSYSLDINYIKNQLEKNKDLKGKELIILIESGALAPPHRMHINLMKMAKQEIEKDLNKIVIGGYIVPSSNEYVRHKLKKDFIKLTHRVNMTKLMIEENSWITVLDWNLACGEEIRMIIEYKIKKEFPNYKINVLLVFGVDFFLRNGVDESKKYVCICRPGYDISPLKKYEKSFIFVENKDDEANSTEIRKAIRENDFESVLKYTSKEVIEYIKNNTIFEF